MANAFKNFQLPELNYRVGQQEHCRPAGVEGSNYSLHLDLQAQNYTVGDKRDGDSPNLKNIIYACLYLLLIGDPAQGSIQLV